MGLCAGKAGYEPKGGPGEVPGEIALPLHEGHILAIKRSSDCLICFDGRLGWETAAGYVPVGVMR